MTTHIITWHWGTKYGPEYIDRLEAGVRRYYRKNFRWVVFQPEPDDLYLTTIPGCFCRLRMFDPVWQRRNGIERGDRIVCMDLDSIVTGPLEPVFERDEPFIILIGANSMNPCPYNGSLMQLRAGAHPEVWSKFSFAEIDKLPRHEFPDDQQWIFKMIPNAAYWRAGYYSGVYAFWKPGWPKGYELPRDARLVVFPGKRDPSQFTHLSWVQEKWVSAAPGHQATPQLLGGLDVHR